MPLFSNNSALKSNDLKQQQQQQQQHNVKLTVTTGALPIIHELSLEPEDASDDYQQSFVAGLEGKLLNSSDVHHVASSSSLCSLLSNCSSTSSTSNISNCSSCSTISKQPSNASKHFENTYKLLGKQLESNCQRTADRLQQLDQQLDSLDSLSSSHASMSAIVNGTEPAPTRLELELEAVERMRVIVQQMKATPQEATANASAPLLALLHDFAAKGQPQPSKAQDDSTPSTPVPSPITGALPADGPNFELPAQLLQTANSWELMYYASKNVDGQNCLKVVRSLLTNKGKH